MSKDRLDQLEAVIREQEMALQHIYATVQAIARGEQEKVEAASDRTPMRDAVWACSNCSFRLGLYDEAKDEMRVRYKDFVVYITPGVGGSVKVPCRRCGDEDVLKDTREVGDV